MSTYYQICSFISLLEHQLIYFTKNIYFNVQLMIENGKRKNLSVRTDCIKAFIKILQVISQKVLMENY